MQRFSHDLASKLAQIDDQALIKGRTFKALLATFMRTLVIPGDGLVGREAPDGLIVDVDAQSLASSLVTRHPFQLRVENTVGFVYPGTLNGQPVTIGSLALDDVPAPSIPLVLETTRVWLKITTNLTFDGDFLISHDDIVGEIGWGATVPPSSSGEWYQQIGTFSDSEVTAQTVINSLWATICDAGAGEASLELAL